MPQSATDYLKDHQLLTLATASTSGEPHAAPCFYANDGLTLYFSVAPNSVSAANLKANGRAAAGVADVPSDWSKARGIQISGAVDELDGDDEAKVGELFKARYPFLGDDALHSHYYRLNPDDVHYIHNEDGGEEEKPNLGVVWTAEHMT
ncbi:MAG TPA: pyridoxamine 5'-phosphate oxidase family protein [Acidimicrobiia bacterium]|nr:pyridoxamine 5'-phosphate oxidase family protein [Acidimicrobiia bacterium]